MLRTDRRVTAELLVATRWDHHVEAVSEVLVGRVWKLRGGRFFVAADGAADRHLLLPAVMVGESGRQFFIWPQGANYIFAILKRVVFKKSCRVFDPHPPDWSTRERKGGTSETAISL